MKRRKTYPKIVPSQMTARDLLTRLRALPKDQLDIPVALAHACGVHPAGYFGMETYAEHTVWELSPARPTQLDRDVSRATDLALAKEAARAAGEVLAPPD